MIKKTATLLILLIIVVSSYAQNDESNHLNIKVKADWENFKTVSCQENGFISYYRDIVKDRLIFSFYDKELNKAWEKSVSVDDNLDFIDQFYDEKSKNLYLLFASGYDRSSQRYVFDYVKDCRLEIISVKTKPEIKGKQNAIKRVKHSIDITSRNLYKQILVSNDQLFLFLEKEKVTELDKLCCNPSFAFNSIFKDQPNHFTFMLNTKKDNDNKAIELTKAKMFFHQEAVRAENGDINYLVLTGKSKMKMSQFLYRLGYKNGEIKYKRSLSKNENNNNEIIAYSPIQKGNQLILCGLIKDKNSRRQTGLKFSYIEDGKEQDINKLSLKEALGRENKDRNKSTFVHGRGSGNIMLLFHNKAYQMNDDGDYIIIGESMKPNISGSDFEILGYIYKEAYIMAFDKDNNLLWNKKFDMNDIEFRPPERIPRIVAKKVAKNKLQLLFPKKEEISFLTIKNGQDRGRPRSLRLTSRAKKKKIKFSSPINVQYWYDDLFLATGYRKAKKSDSFLSGKDKMHYISPINFE